MKKNPSRALLDNRLFAVGTLIFCSSASAEAWLGITRYGRFPHDVIRVFGLGFVVFCAASITFRSPLAAERRTFGAITASFLLIALRMAPLTLRAMQVVQAVEAITWATGAAICLIILTHNLRAPHRE
jgi:hypothetical protein